jgi:hypothetical protein
VKKKRTYGTTEVAEKYSVSSKKQMKSQRLGRCKIDLFAEDEVICGEKGIVQLEGTKGSE